jgi:hypothetical protein
MHHDRRVCWLNLGETPSWIGAIAHGGSLVQYANPGSPCIFRAALGARPQLASGFLILTPVKRRKSESFVNRVAP